MSFPFGSSSFQSSGLTLVAADAHSLRVAGSVEVPTRRSKLSLRMIALQAHPLGKCLLGCVIAGGGALFQVN